MAVPKKKKSHSRTRMQRSHDALTPAAWITCAQCREPMTRHQVCRACGYYRGREVIAKEA
jgi:large subunit ribosomal protein L32